MLEKRLEKPFVNLTKEILFGQALTAFFFPAAEHKHGLQSLKK